MNDKENEIIDNVINDWLLQYEKIKEFMEILADENKVHNIHQ